TDTPRLSRPPEQPGARAAEHPSPEIRLDHAQPLRRADIVEPLLRRDRGQRKLLDQPGEALLLERALLPGWYDLYPLGAQRQHAGVDEAMTRSGGVLLVPRHESAFVYVDVGHDARLAVAVLEQSDDRRRLSLRETPFEDAVLNGQKRIAVDQQKRIGEQRRRISSSAAGSAWAW